MEGVIYVFQGEKVAIVPNFILCTKVWKLVPKGCCVWIAAISTTKEESLEVSKIPVVSEYYDVF